MIPSWKNIFRLMVILASLDFAMALSLIWWEKSLVWTAAAGGGMVYNIAQGIWEMTLL